MMASSLQSGPMDAAIIKSEQARNANTFHSSVSWPCTPWPKPQKAANHIRFADFSKVTHQQDCAQGFWSVSQEVPSPIAPRRMKGRQEKVDIAAGCMREAEAELE
ncbi:hypothetical protein U0070_024914 [Myodes glareolus]|uniref:Uncharacterized protein n=1 Tax=Myodes glareolus TaxID=447135 RepID=A0AAW0ISY2_MYOGA